MRVNGLLLLHAPLGQIYLGTLTVDTTGPLGGTIAATGMARAGADLSLETIGGSSMVVAATPTPEPGALLQIAAAIGTLAGLRCWRARRAGRIAA